MRIRTLLLVLLTAMPAGAVLDIDPAQSLLTPSVGSPETLSGQIAVTTGAPLPIASTTTFELDSLTATASGGLQITLDGSLSNPASGVLNPAGGFLIPTLFLTLDDAGNLFDLSVPNVTGQYGDFLGCPTDLCLDTTFDIDTGGPSGIVTVTFFAVPEPGSFGLAAFGLLGLAASRRRRVGQSR